MHRLAFAFVWRGYSLPPKTCIRMTEREKTWAAHASG